MSNREIINYIKIRDQWKDTLWAKASAKAKIWNGLFNFGSFLAYWAVEKFLLDYDRIYQQFPDFKYLFYLSLILGLWGLLNSLFGVFEYFSAQQQAEQLQQEVMRLEKELI